MKTSISTLHHQGTDWLRELEFYKEEIAILTTRLEEVASKNTNKEVLAQVEHFQNKFIMLREQLDILKHDVNQRNEEVTELAKTRPEHINERFGTVNDKLLERMKDFAHSIADTRFEFNAFLSKTL
jgi:predicted  nucleic acid-binding Zn-ribbon protein